MASRARGPRAAHWRRVASFMRVGVFCERRLARRGAHARFDRARTVGQRNDDPEDDLGDSNGPSPEASGSRPAAERASGVGARLALQACGGPGAGPGPGGQRASNLGALRGPAGPSQARPRTLEQLLGPLPPAAWGWGVPGGVGARAGSPRAHALGGSATGAFGTAGLLRSGQGEHVCDPTKAAAPLANPGRTFAPSMRSHGIRFPWRGRLFPARGSDAGR